MGTKNSIGAIALLAGTAIGAAILALPVATAHLGLMRTLLVYGVCWFFMTLGALYLLEVNLASGYGSNLISMSEKTLGQAGKYFTWLIYLTLLYALTAAYLQGISLWFTHALNHFELTLSSSQSALLITLFTLMIICLGTTLTDWINRLLMIGLVISFISLIAITLPQTQSSLLLANGYFDLKPFALIITAFGSAIVVPTLTDYLHHQPKSLCYVVLIGSAIPLVVYILWEITIIGTIPLLGEPGLLSIQQRDHAVTDITHALQHLLKNAWIIQGACYFSIFALITSLLGVSLALFDFLANGLKLTKNLRTKPILALITFLPPLAIIIFYPQGFMLTLSLAGIFAALLLGLLPALMVWQARYRHHLPRQFEVWGGKFLVLLTMLFFIFIAAIETFYQWHR